MATTLRFREHEEFHRATLHMAIAGGLSALAFHVLSLLFPVFGDVLGSWGIATIAGATLYGATAPSVRTRVTELALLVAVSLGLGVALRVASGLGRADTLGLAALAVAMGALLARGGRRGFATFTGAAAAVLLSRFVLDTFVG